MLPSAIQILCCPDDGAGPLALSDTTPEGGDWIDDGRLSCPRCRRTFTVRSGIASMLPAELAAPREDSEGAALRGMKAEMRVRDEESELYDQLYDDASYRFEIETYVSQLAASADETILDVGCGTGRITKEYVESCRRVVGADFSHESLVAFRSRLAPDVARRTCLVQCEVGHLPFIDAAFDAVVSTSLFSNVPTKETREAGLVEVARVLAPRGRFLVTVYNHCWLKRMRQRVGLSRSGLKQGYHSGGGVHYYNFSPEEFRDWVGSRFEPGPLFGLMHRLPVLSKLSPGIAVAIDRLSFRLPGSLRLIAKEMGVVARPRDDQT